MTKNNKCLLMFISICLFVAMYMMCTVCIMYIMCRMCIMCIAYNVYDVYDVHEKEIERHIYIDRQNYKEESGVIINIKNSDHFLIENLCYI